VKSLPIASLALVLALSGCSSSPSIEEQTKLVEYEKCLENVQTFLRIEFQAGALGRNYITQDVRNRLVIETLKYSDDMCAYLRP
jgi:hypothetical protein